MIDVALKILEIIKILPLLFLDHLMHRESVRVHTGVAQLGSCSGLLTGCVTLGKMFNLSKLRILQEDY